MASDVAQYRFYQGDFCPSCSAIWDTKPIREVSDLNGQQDGKQQHCPVDIYPLMGGEADSPIRC